jgi:hypothetical protein
VVEHSPYKRGVRRFETYCAHEVIPARWPFCIADLVGHKGTLTTETVYRKGIVAELRRGAEVMDRLFS